MIKGSKILHKENCRNSNGVSYTQVLAGDYDKDCPRCSFCAKIILR